MPNQNRHKDVSTARPRIATKRATTWAPSVIRLEPWLPLLLVVLGVTVYTNGLTGPFVFDDVKHILESPQAQRLALDIRTERPLLFFSLGMNYWLGEFNPLGYKIFNLIVHLLAALTLYDLVRRTLLLPRFDGHFHNVAAGLAFAVAALWVVHPLTTESVTYIIHRGESMMGLFALLTLYGTLRGAQSSPHWRSWLWYAAAAVACTFGFWSKPWMIAVPVVVLLYDRIMLRGPWKTWAIQRGALYVLLLLPLGWAFWLFRHDSLNRLEISPTATKQDRSPQEAPPRQPASPVAKPPSRSAATVGQDPLVDPHFETGFPQRVSPLRYALTQPEVIAHYLKLVFSPYPLCADYFWKPAYTAGRIIPPALLIGSLLLATGWALWRYPAWGFLGAAFFLLLGPSSSFMPIEDIATERRMYLPLTAVIALLVLGAWQVLGRISPRGPLAQRQRRVRGVALLLLVLAIWGGLTVLRNFDYASDIEFSERIVQQVPYNSRAVVNLARALTNEADRPENQPVRKEYYQEALRQLEAIAPLAPKSAFVHAQIGHVQAQLGNHPEAIKRFRQAVALHDNSPLFYMNLALVLERQETPAAREEALQAFQKVIALSDKSDPRTAEAHAGMARIYTAKAQWNDAEREYEQALQLLPGNMKYGMDLGMLLVQMQRWEDARDRLLHTNQIHRQWLEQGGAPVVEIPQYLALVYAEMKQYPQAIEAAQEALRLATQTQQAEKAAELRLTIENLQADLRQTNDAVHRPAP